MSIGIRLRLQSQHTVDILSDILVYSNLNKMFKRLGNTLPHLCCLFEHSLRPTKANFHVQRAYFVKKLHLIMLRPPHSSTLLRIFYEFSNILHVNNYFDTFAIILSVPFMTDT